jgi:hypothetical protein
VNSIMIVLQSSQVGLVSLQMLKTLLTLFRKVPKFSEPSENFGIFREFRNLPRISEPSENLGRFRNFRNLPKISEGSENFGRFRKFRKVPKNYNAFRNAGSTTSTLLEHSTNIHDKKNIRIVYYIRNGSENSASGQKSSEISEISIEKVGLPIISPRLGCMDHEVPSVKVYAMLFS